MPPPAEVRIRPFQEADRAFLRGLMPRLVPATTASPRQPGALARSLDRQAAGEQSYPPGTAIFVAIVGDAPAGMVAIRPDADHFTGHPRAYVELLAVAEEAEGRGIGRVLVAHAEQWARAHHCVEVVLNVFAGNEAAIAFYRRLGFAPDHIRMTKAVSPVAAPPVTRDA